MSGAREWEHVGDAGGLRVERDPVSGALLLVDMWSKECVYVQGRNVVRLLEVMTSAEHTSARERTMRAHK